MNNPLVYLCGPITGLSYDEARHGWRSLMRELVHPDIGLLSPMRQEQHLSEIKTISHEAYPENPVSTARAIVAKDLLDVQRSTLLVANFVGAKAISVGSVCEIGWAYALGKQIIAVIEEKDNVHDRFFLTEQFSYVVRDTRQAADIVNALLLPGV